MTPGRALDAIGALRGLHLEHDHAVHDAYVWWDLDIAHDFVEVETLPENDRLRLTISPAARAEFLRHLLALNHARSAAEVSKYPTTAERRTLRLRKPEASGELF